MPQIAFEFNKWILMINDCHYFIFSYETGNNIVAEESGFFKDINEDGDGTLVQKGSYSYETPDGQVR